MKLDRMIRISEEACQILRRHKLLDRETYDAVIKRTLGKRKVLSKNKQLLIEKGLDKGAKTK